MADTKRGGQQNQQSKPWSDNFLEILKKNSSGFPKEPASREQYLRRRLFAERVQKTEQEIYNGRQRELNQQTQALLAELREEIQNLKQSEKSLVREVEKAVEAPPLAPSPHYLSFLEHIKTIVVKLREKVENASSWLAAWNQKQRKRGFFWNTFLARKKGGVQFLLSSEHYLTRSAG